MASPSPSSSKPRTPEPGSGSYTAMSTADVEAIGAHCQMPFCHVLDFLPFRCESCHGSFCLDHRTESGHSCPQAGAWARARRRQQQQQQQQQQPTTSSPSSMLNASSSPSSPKSNTPTKHCASPHCKTAIDGPLKTGVHCATCNRSYCLKHRLREDHACASLAPLGARSTAAAAGPSQKQRGAAALEKLRAWGAAKQKSFALPASSSRAAASAQAAALATLKRTARGDATLPPEKRIYVHVEASAATASAATASAAAKYPAGAFFYSAEWSVGGVLDAAARALQLANVNNRVEGEAERLRVFHVEDGRLLEFGDRLGAVVASGNTLVLLRGVGPPAPDLIRV
ncbi:hypothetical protein B0A49_01597 [Cryomyces minteri]|uniref:AN1-type domain-containing protein n=1 Tax=Cryomyces minteri TaxID=331657 RepID=A0A4U0XSS3_9PEZI|nr:hypothetical protein B0A49_01597 [Cryomyces minteri]